MPPSVCRESAYRGGTADGGVNERALVQQKAPLLGWWRFAAVYLSKRLFRLLGGNICQGLVICALTFFLVFQLGKNNIKQRSVIRASADVAS